MSPRTTTIRFPASSTCRFDCATHPAADPAQMGHHSFLDQGESDALEAQIAALEAQTGVQIVAAVIGKADSYVELPWKAFALGASLAGAGAGRLRHDVAAMGHGDALLVHGCDPWRRCGQRARWRCSRPPTRGCSCGRARRDLEVRHYAQALFLRRELFGTRERNGILLLVSCSSAKSKSCRRRLARAVRCRADWRTVIDAMTPLLRARRCSGALQQGSRACRRCWSPPEGCPPRPAENELPDRPVQERGAS